MKVEQIAAQLYTVREHIKTPSDIARSMKKVRDIGYTVVQVSGIGPIEEEELAKILAGEGLVCCATHEGNILKDPNVVAERLNKLSCAYTAVPSPGRELKTVADVDAFVADLDRAGKVLADKGKILTYHNHSGEFRRFDGRLILEMIYDGTDARYLKGEIDTYWVQYGGGDPVSWCERLHDRLPLLHMKDYITTSEHKPAFAEIGRGNLDWRRIVAASEASGCEWFIVEQDRCEADPFDSLKLSFDYIREELCT